MARILITSFITREYKPFLESLPKFVSDCSKEHIITVIELKDKLLADAQNEATEIFLKDNFEYLLFLDDDHWGHTKDMLNCLIDADAYMATIKSYSRHYPYSCALMKRIPGTYAGIENGSGYMECDLTGFPMTLFRRDLFNKLDKPYFIPKFDGARDWATDENFCRNLISKGIKPVGCFQHCLPHQDITQDNVFNRRADERFENNNMMLYNLFNKRIKQGV